MTKADLVNEIAKNTGIEKSECIGSCRIFYDSCERFFGKGRKCIFERFRQLYHQRKSSKNST